MRGTLLQPLGIRFCFSSESTLIADRDHTNFSFIFQFSVYLGALSFYALRSEGYSNLNWLSKEMMYFQLTPDFDSENDLIEKS